MDTSTILISIFAVAAVGCFGWAIWLLLENQRLSSKAEREKAKILADAESEKQRILENRRNALWLLYLSELSLQASVSALHREQQRSASLKESHQGTLNKYGKFAEKVQNSAKRRLVGKGVGAALSLVPGLGLFEVAKDLIEIASEAEETSEEIKTVTDAFTELSSDVETEFSNISTDDEVPIALTQDKQNVFKEAFEQNVGSDLDTLNASSLESCVKDTVLNMGDSETVQSMTDEEQDDAIEEILRKVEDVVKDASRDHQDRKERQERNADRSETEQDSQSSLLG